MTSGSTTWEYTYNADGLRTKRTNGTDTYSYIYNGSKLTAMTKGSDTLYFIYDASGTPLEVNYNNATYYYTVNLQGDILGIVDNSGNTVVTYAYDAWGNLLSVSGSMASTLGIINPLRYRGYVYDTETELYYLQSRYYNPEWGRFINADGLVTTGQGFVGNNMFAYCGNNPVSRIDDSGSFWLISMGIGLLKQYAGDVLNNIASGKSGWDILVPTSSPSEYLASAVCELIPGDGPIDNLVSNVISEGFTMAEAAIRGDDIDWGESITDVVTGTLLDCGVDYASDKIAGAIRNSGPQNYSQYAHEARKKQPDLSKNDIYKKMRRKQNTLSGLADTASFAVEMVASLLLDLRGG